MLETIVIILTMLLTALPFFVPLMWYTKEPQRPNWDKTKEQLFDEQSNDKIRNKFAQMARDKKLETLNGKLYVSKEVKGSLERNEVIMGTALAYGQNSMYRFNSYRDVKVEAKINNDDSTYSVIVKSLEGEILESDGRRFNINKRLNPGCSGVVIEMRWILPTKDSEMAVVAYYPNILTKISDGIGALKWKK